MGELDKKCIKKDNRVDGYARVLTDNEGRIIYVFEWYSSDEKLHGFLTDMSFQDWIESSECKDAEVLILYKSAEYCQTQEGTEYEDELEVIEEYLMKENYRSCFVKMIEDSLKFEQEEHKKGIGFGLYSELFGSRKHLVLELIREFEDMYDEEYIVEEQKNL